MVFLKGAHGHCSDGGTEDLGDEFFGFEGVADEDPVLEPINPTLFQSLEMLWAPDGKLLRVSLYCCVGEGATALMGTYLSERKSGWGKMLGVLLILSR